MARQGRRYLFIEDYLMASSRRSGLAIRRIGKFLRLSFFSVIVVVSVVIVRIVASAYINPVDHNPKDFRIHLMKDIFCALEGFSWCLTALNDEDDSIYKGGENDGVGKGEDRRGIENDVIELLTKELHRGLKEVRAQKF